MLRTNITLEFADGEYEFRLTLAGIQELQEKSKADFGVIFGRLLAGRYTSTKGSFGMPLEAKWNINDLVSVVRLGLIGGKRGIVDGQTIEVTPIIAQRLIQTYVIDHPLKHAWDLAAAIVWACVEGIEDNEHEVKKKPARRRRKANGSTSPKRSEPAPAVASIPSPQVN